MSWCLGQTVGWRRGEEAGLPKEWLWHLMPDIALVTFSFNGN